MDSLPGKPMIRRSVDPAYLRIACCLQSRLKTSRSRIATIVGGEKQNGPGCELRCERGQVPGIPMIDDLHCEGPWIRAVKRQKIRGLGLEFLLEASHKLLASHPFSAAGGRRDIPRANHDGSQYGWFMRHG